MILQILAALVFVSPLTDHLLCAWRDERVAREFDSIAEFERMRAALAPGPTR